MAAGGGSGVLGCGYGHRTPSAGEGRPGDKVAVLSPSFAAPGVGAGGARAGDAAAGGADRAGPGGVPDHSPARRVCAGPGGRPQRRVSRPRDPWRCWPPSAARTRSRWSRTSTLRRPGPTRNRSSATATTPTSCPGCGRTGVAGFYGGSTQVHLGRARPSTTVHSAALRAACSPASGWRSPSPASPRTSARTGPTRRRSPSSATASPPSRGPGPDRAER